MNKKLLKKQEVYKIVIIFVNSLFQNQELEVSENSESGKELSLEI